MSLSSRDGLLAEMRINSCMLFRGFSQDTSLAVDNEFFGEEEDTEALITEQNGSPSATEETEDGDVEPSAKRMKVEPVRLFSYFVSSIEYALNLYCCLFLFSLCRTPLKKQLLYQVQNCCVYSFVQRALLLFFTVPW